MAAVSQTMFSSTLSWMKNFWIPIKISLKFVPKGRINTIPALVQIMAWRLDGAKPLSEPMVFSIPTHICVTRPQWVNARSQWKSHGSYSRLHIRDSYNLGERRYFTSLLDKMWFTHICQRILTFNSILFHSVVIHTFLKCFPKVNMANKKGTRGLRDGCIS